MSDETAAPSPIPPNPFKVVATGVLPDGSIFVGRVVVYQDPEGGCSPCDAQGREVEAGSADVAGIIVHPDIAAAMWRAAIADDEGAGE